MLAINAPADEMIISCNYYDLGEGPRVDLFDNPLCGWLVDDTGAAPLAPLIIGTLPPPADPAPEPPAASPQWAFYRSASAYVPDLWRGSLHDFLTWIASSNGTQRLVRGDFRHTALQNTIRAWAAANPTLFNPAPF